MGNAATSVREGACVSIAARYDVLKMYVRDILRFFILQNKTTRSMKISHIFKEFPMDYTKKFISLCVCIRVTLGIKRFLKIHKCLAEFFLKPAKFSSVYSNLFHMDTMYVYQCIAMHFEKEINGLNRIFMQ